MGLGLEFQVKKDCFSNEQGSWESADACMGSPGALGPRFWAWYLHVREDADVVRATEDIPLLHLHLLSLLVLVRSPQVVVILTREHPQSKDRGDLTQGPRHAPWDSPLERVQGSMTSSSPGHGNGYVVMGRGLTSEKRNPWVQKYWVEGPDSSSTSDSVNVRCCW